jgi:pyruvate dehydrogenase E2 component (dihydrolipoamide acetyltransferase)
VSEAIEVRVPDIGDFRDVPVIEILVKPGDVVERETPLVMLESEKASMEVPSPEAGTVQSVVVKIGDKVSMGSTLLTLAAGAAAAAPAPAPTPATPAPSAPQTTAPQQATPKTPAAPAVTKTESVIEVRVPDIGDFNDIPVIEVLVKPGDAVERETPLVMLESEKASMEVPSPEAGTVKSVALKAGDKVSKGSIVLTLTTSSAATSSAAPAASAQPSQAAPATPAAAPSAQAPANRVSATAPESGAAVHASPSIRRFARELGVQLGLVSASGPNGRITRDDVQSFVKNALSAGPRAAGTVLDLPPWPRVDFAKFGPIEVQPLSRIQKISGPSLARNWVMIPHVTNNEDADITDLDEFRKQLNAETPNVKMTMLAFLVKAVVSALQHFPNVNSSLDGDNLVLKKYYNIGFAADTPNGLLVPVIKNADKKGVLEVAAETRDLAAKARDGKLGLADMQGATFTISSLGGIGGTSFTPIINAPEVAILGASRASLRPVWNGKIFEPRLILPLSLSYDHRVIDGAQAARFNAFLAGVLADMRRAML